MTEKVAAAAPPICHDLQQWAASDAEAVYRQIDPAFITRRGLPRTIESEVHESFFPLCEWEVPARVIASISKARLRGKWGLVILPDGSYVGETVAATPAGQAALLKKQPAFRTRFRGKKDRKSGQFISLLGLNRDHYYHWSHDVIMRLRGVKHYLPSGTKVIVPSSIRPFQKETLEMLELNSISRPN